MVVMGERMPAKGIGMPIDKQYRDADNGFMTYAELMDFFKTQKAAAEAIGLKQPSVAEWKESGIPEPRQAQYELVTHGKLKADRPIGARA
jgi:hypothetical protein